MGGMTIRIVPIEPPWFEEKAQVQSCTWRELNQGHIPQGIVDAITPEFALKLTRSHDTSPSSLRCTWRAVRTGASPSLSITREDLWLLTSCTPQIAVSCRSSNP